MDPKQQRPLSREARLAIYFSALVYSVENLGRLIEADDAAHLATVPDAPTVDGVRETLG